MIKNKPSIRTLYNKKTHDNKNLFLKEISKVISDLDHL